MGSRRGRCAPASVGSARIVKLEPERVVVETDALRRALLVLSDVHYPGWKATVDGRETPIQRVDYLLRGVPLEAGGHTVEFRYEPDSWRVGWIVSLVALVGLVGVLLWVLVRRRRTAVT